MCSAWFTIVPVSQIFFYFTLIRYPLIIPSGFWFFSIWRHFLYFQDKDRRRSHYYELSRNGLRHIPNFKHHFCTQFALSFIKEKLWSGRVAENIAAANNTFCLLVYLRNPSGDYHHILNENDALHSKKKKRLSTCILGGYQLSEWNKHELSYLYLF